MLSCSLDDPLKTDRWLGELALTEGIVLNMLLEKCLEVAPHVLDTATTGFDRFTGRRIV
jgi:hypothetical protein